MGVGGKTASLLMSPPKRMPKKPIAGAMSPRKVKDTHFRKFYERGDFPIAVQHRSSNIINWKVDIHQMDLHRYLPMFFEGIREKHEPYRFFAVEGCVDIMNAGGEKVTPVLPSLILHIKSKSYKATHLLTAALGTRDAEIIAITLKIL